jgi:hypothetical protein
VLLRGIDAYLRELGRLQRSPTPALLPEWAQEPDPTVTAEVRP